MRLALISGSPRPRSQSIRVAGYVAGRQRALFPEGAIDLLDLAELALPPWTGDFAGHPISDPGSAWSSVSAILQAADSLVAIVPEHHGMAPPAFMNLLLLCRDELAHKPGLIVALSATDGGAYPTVQLRGSVTKNNRLCWIPEQVVIRNVKQTLTDEAFDLADRVKARIDYGLKLLDAYRGALTSVREAGLIDHATFAFGQ